MAISIFLGIDGTSVDDTETNGADWQLSSNQSYVRRMVNTFSLGPSHYLGGISGLGFNADNLAKLGFAWIKEQLKSTQTNPVLWGVNIKPQQTKIYMAGYSRGGAAMIHTCNLLKNEMPDVKISGLFLFDAVDRSTSLSNVQIIPENVRMIYHGMRDFTTGSRQTWGNCGKVASGGGTLHIKKFFTTHGGMGGKLRFDLQNNKKLPFGSGANSNSTSPMTSNQAFLAEADILGLGGKLETNVTPMVGFSASLAAWSWMQQGYQNTVGMQGN